MHVRLLHLDEVEAGCGFISMARASASLRTTCLWTWESGGTSMTRSPRICVWQERRRPAGKPALLVVALLDLGEAVDMDAAM